MNELDRVEIYRSKRPFQSGGGWRWRYVAAGNNKRLATGSEGYRELSDMLESMKRVTGLVVPSLYDPEIEKVHGIPVDDLWGRQDGSALRVVVQL